MSEILIQYKATHPLWGMQKGWDASFGRAVGSLTPKALTPSILMNLMQDFRVRVGIPQDIWNQIVALELVQCEQVIDKGVDSYITLKVGGVFPEGHEYAGMGVREVLRAANVRLALEAWQK